MRSLIALVLALFVLSEVADAGCYGARRVQQQVVCQQSYAAPVVVQQAPVVYAQPAVVQVPAVQTYTVAVPMVQQQVVYQQQQVYAAPVVQQQAVYAQQNVVVRQQAANVYGAGFGRAGGGGFLSGISNGQGGLLGAAERFTGLGSGDGQFLQGAGVGILASRANLFGLGNGGAGSGRRR